jgi:hypothetical protein
MRLTPTAYPLTQGGQAQYSAATGAKQRSTLRELCKVGVNALAETIPCAALRPGIWLWTLLTKAKVPGLSGRELMAARES